MNMGGVLRWELTRCVDAGISLQDLDTMAFASAFYRGRQAGETSTDDQDIDAAAWV